MAKFQIYQFMFRPINENQLELPFEEFHAITIYTNTASMLTKITSIYCAWPIIRKQRLNQTSTLQN